MTAQVSDESSFVSLVQAGPQVTTESVYAVLIQNTIQISDESSFVSFVQPGQQIATESAYVVMLPSIAKRRKNTFIP